MLFPHLFNAFPLQLSRTPADLITEGILRRPTGETKMPRTTIEFSPQADGHLNSLADALHVTKAEVVRSALSLYAYVAEKLQSNPARELAIIETGPNGQDTIKQVIAVPSIVRQPMPASAAKARAVSP